MRTGTSLQEVNSRAFLLQFLKKEDIGQLEVKTDYDLHKSHQWWIKLKKKKTKQTTINHHFTFCILPMWAFTELKLTSSSSLSGTEGTGLLSC